MAARGAPRRGGDSSGRPGDAVPAAPRAALGARLGRARALARGRRLALALLVLLAAGGMVGLGCWQFGRLTTRRAINATIERRRAQPTVTLDARAAATADPATIAERRVTVGGTWDYAGEVVLRNRAYQQLTGVHLLTPLRIDGSDRAILVDRGWIPYTEAAPDRRRAYRQPARGAVQGLAHESRPPSGAPPGNSLAARQDAWLTADVAGIQRQVPYPLLPVWVEQAAVPGRAALPIPDPTLALDDGPHLGYAIQWWGFAAILLAGYLVVMTQEPGTTRLQPLRARSAERGARNSTTDNVSG